ncbi:hypothetical protein B566_EDAN009718 [Ephemera danica]|nr:hypothetical protein B566_EDAN009718 [Ephemera danica]
MKVLSGAKTRNVSSDAQGGVNAASTRAGRLGPLLQTSRSPTQKFLEIWVLLSDAHLFVFLLLLLRLVTCVTFVSTYSVCLGVLDKLVTAAADLMSAAAIKKPSKNAGGED